MNAADRLRLLGTYTTPRVRLGTVLSCEHRDGDVVVVGYSDGRIPWPVGRRKGQGGAGCPVLYGVLVKAVRRESLVAVCHWFGVSPQTASRWRKALGVGFSTEGTVRLKSDYNKEPWAHAARKKAVAKARDPDR